MFRSSSAFGGLARIGRLIDAWLADGANEAKIIRIMHRDGLGGAKEVARRYPEWTGWPEFNPCL